MKLLTFEHASKVRLGVVHDADPSRIHDLTQALPGAPADMAWLLSQGPSLLAEVRRVAAGSGATLDAAAIKWRAPIPRPGKFLGVGGNLESHLLEVAHLGMKRPVHPIWFNKQSTCASGPFDPIWLPRGSDQLDYEGELGVVIGRRCRDVSVEDAPGVIAGYVVCNDVSVRDWQMRAPTATMGKSFDTHGPFGPWIVTPDEVGDPQVLRIRTWVNGELRQDGSTTEMVFDCAQLISDVSRMCTLEPGDVLSTGSPAGVGGLRQPPAYLRIGDVVRVEVERVGAIESTVVADPGFASSSH